MKKPQFLMCPPDYFDIEYSINPWMDASTKVESSMKEQWQKLHDTFFEVGAEVQLMSPQKGWPDMTYVDVGVLYKDIFVPSNFMYPERQGESPYSIDWFEDNDFKIKQIDSTFALEGHGDTLWAGDRLFCGYGFRSTVEAHHELSRILNEIGDVDVIPIELIDARLYHLDTCFCPLDKNTAFYFPGAFSKKAQRMLEKNIDLIPISEEDALKFACNAVVIDKHILIPSGAKETNEMLERLGFTVHEIPMSEFMKGGGACKCLSMPL